MPVAFVIGWEPSMGFTGGAPIPRSISEYDIMGSIRGKPVDLVDCETVPLQVPADAEMVIEGWISTDPSTFEAEGPYAEFTGYYAPDRSPKHVAQITCITHREKPILRGCVEGAIPGSYGENPIMSSIQRSATAWNALESAGVPGVVDVFGMPIQACVNTVVSINQTYRGQAKQVAAAQLPAYGLPFGGRGHGQQNEALQSPAHDPARQAVAPRPPPAADQEVLSRVPCAGRVRHAHHSASRGGVHLPHGHLYLVFDRRQPARLGVQQVPTGRLALSGARLSTSSRHGV